MRDIEICLDQLSAFSPVSHWDLKSMELAETRIHFWQNSWQWFLLTWLQQMYFEAQIGAYKGKETKCVDETFLEILMYLRHFSVLFPISCIHPCFHVSGAAVFGSAQSPFRHIVTPKFPDSYARNDFFIWNSDSSLPTPVSWSSSTYNIGFLSEIVRILFS